MSSENSASGYDNFKSYSEISSKSMQKQVSVETPTKKEIYENTQKLNDQYTYSQPVRGSFYQESRIVTNSIAGKDSIVFEDFYKQILDDIKLR